MSIPIVILGTGGTSRDILDTLLDVNDAGGVQYDCIGFLDDEASRWGGVIRGVPIRGPLTAARELVGCVFVNGIGSPRNFREKERLIQSTGVSADRFVSLVHPTASVSRAARLGCGTVILQHVTVTAGARLGNHVVVLPNSVISHDVEIGDYTCVAGGVAISGEVRIGAGCYIGSRACVKEGLVVGDGVLVGMGSVVLRDVDRDAVVIGTPARLLAATPSSCASARAPRARQSRFDVSR